VDARQRGVIDVTYWATADAIDLTLFKRAAAPQGAASED
jgi:hypothetical protein